MISGSGKSIVGLVLANEKLEWDVVLDLHVNICTLICVLSLKLCNLILL